MNNIYKVIWSKAKNCYVVASEIARSHTKSASGSEKIGGVARRSLLASLMALSLLCGGLGVASAADSTVHVDASTTPSNATEVYTTTGVNTLLADYGKKTDVETNKNDITALRTTTTDQGKLITENATNIARNTADIEKKIDRETANATYATKDALRNLNDTVDDKADEAAVTTALDGKADKTAVTALEGRVSGVEERVTTLEGTVGNATIGLVKDVADLKNQVNTELGTKANQSDLVAATNRITANEGNITALQKKTAKLSDDGMKLTGMTAVGGATVSGTTVNARALKVTGKISDGTVKTTLAEIDASMKQTETNKADIVNLKTTTGEQDTAIKDLQKKTTNISYADGAGTSIDGITVKDGNIVGNGNSAITGITNITTDNINGKSLAGTTVATVKEVTDAVESEKTERENADKALSDRIGNLTGDKNYIKKGMNVSDNLVELDTRAKTNADNIQTNANNIKNNKDEIARVNGELVKTNDYFNTELGKTNDYFNTELGKTNNHFNTELGKTNAALQEEGKVRANADAALASDITATNKRTAGIGRTDTGVEADNQTVIEGKVHFDQNGNVSGVKDLKTDTIHATGEITSEGLDAGSGEIQTKGKVSAGDVSTVTLETTGKATIGGNLDVEGTLNIKDVTAETIHVSKSEDNADYKSEGSIIGDGGKLSVSNEKTDKRTNITEKSELNVNEKGTVNWATSTDNATGNVTEGRSEVTADNIKNSVKKTEGGKTFGYEENITETGKVGTATDKDGNRNELTQTATGTENTVTSKDGNKSTTKQEAGSISSTVYDQDGNVKASSEMKEDGSISNNATGDMTNTVGGKLTTTVTGQATEEFNGGLNTTVTGTENHTVNGKQINTVTESQENIISGGQTNTITGGQINNITGDQTTTITGNKTETVTENVTEDYQKNLTTTVGGNEIHDVKGTKTETVEGKVTENFKGGQETNVTGNQDIHVTGKQTNKIDGDQENTIGGNQTTTVTGDISNKAKNITNEASNSITDKVGDHTRVLDGEGITDTVGGSTFKQRIDKIMMESKDVSIKAEETLTNEAKVITNKASEVINNEAININNTATGIITSKASAIKNQADKLISNKVGENTWENMEDGKITTSIKDGTKQNLTQSNAAGTTQSTVDGAKSTVTIQNADGLQTGVTNGTSTNASATTATSSAQTIASGSKANSVITTIDGTQFVNTDAAAPVTGGSGAGTAVNTTIKGNTITTGKVTMDYADVMKDLGVRGNANITGKTTTGSLEVTGTSTLKGDVTMGSNATVKKDLTVEGNTNLKNTKVDGTLDVTQKATFGDSVSIAKDLSVDGNATIKGDVTAKSYKVGDKTYISADGINANDQKITNVADGSISEGSKDAVNGGQLYTVKNDLEGKVNKVGANAAAMANLHPMEFDPSSKWNIAAAIGNYGSETAAALGAFYRPNDDVMVNLSTAFGTGENMVGGGVSVRLGKGGNKLSREETNALKAQVNDLTARMDALLSVLNPNMSKDFPDVPENHWAYEAVSRLAGNDIVQGYPDGEFHGERTMTRYEMAEIIYNALSRGAEAEKELVEEFKPELQAMAASEKATAERAEG